MAQPISKGKTGANAVFFVLLAVAAMGLLNVVGARYFKRFDMTEEKVYTLSPGSKDLVRKLPDRMNVKLFMSEELKPPFKGHAQFVRDLLGEYATESGGKFNVEVIKIGENDKAKEEEAQKYGIKKGRRGVISANKFEIGSSFLGIAFDYHGQVEQIKEIQQVEGLEFEISGLVKRMTVKKRKLALATSEGEAGIAHQGGLQILDDQLKKSGYELSSLELKAKIPEDVDALLIIGPKQKMSERGKYVVDQFLMRGKSVAFFVDGQTMTTPRGNMMPGMDMPQIAQGNETDLDDLLGAYGLKVDKDMILDERNYIGPVAIEGNLFAANHPVFLRVQPLPQVHQVNQNLQAVALPYASSVELVGEGKDGKNGVKYTKLMDSSKRSWRPSGPFVFTPMPPEFPSGGDHGPFALGYAAEGKFKSAFAGKQIVKEDGSKVDGNVSQPGIEPMLTESKGNARLLLIGDSDFINDQYLNIGLRSGFQMYVANLVYVLNIVDWLAQDEALAQVRNKGMQNRPISQVGESTVTLVKAANIVGVPLLLIVIGLVRWRIRSAVRASAKL